VPRKPEVDHDYVTDHTHQRRISNHVLERSVERRTVLDTATAD